MSKEDQQLPFDIPQDNQQPQLDVVPDPPVDLSEIAQKIGQTARIFEYPDRTSEAAKDQGHGPIDIPATDSPILPVTPIGIEKSRRAHPSARSQPSKPRGAKVYELPGKPGRSNQPKVTGQPSKEHVEAFDRSKSDRDELRRKLRQKDQK